MVNLDNYATANTILTPILGKNILIKSKNNNFIHLFHPINYKKEISNK
ncbi:hypothetical protein C8N28_0877 [Albibacterium bauzanense]|uniref:Uncharacterized protein n=1 Tax=Albibacterium bauzanense TaxID=653929 RepID=A0A4R1M0W1_9SPHI|nr:hypothetical protein C8N28_0877 [Albibacterium bauzanense]